MLSHVFLESSGNAAFGTRAILILCLFLVLRPSAGAQAAGDLVSTGTNSWLFHTPDDGRSTLYIAPSVPGGWNWATCALFQNDGTFTFHGSSDSNGAILGVYNSGFGPLAPAILRAASSRGIGVQLQTFNEDAILNVYSNHPLSFRTNNTERMRIDAVGRVGIGASAPMASLDIPGNAQALPTLKIGHGSNAPTADIPTAVVYGRATTAGVLQVVGVANSPSGNSNLITASPDSGASPVLVLDRTGRLGLGTVSPTEKLAVNGKIRAKEVIVETTGWADYVFEPGYALPTLAATEQHIAEHGHLPGMPSATEVAAQGVSIGELQAKLLQKIEEMTLHQIALEKRIKELEKQVALR